MPMRRFSASQFYGAVLSLELADGFFMQSDPPEAQFQSGPQPVARSPFGNLTKAKNEKAQRTRAMTIAAMSPRFREDERRFIRHCSGQRIERSSYS
jgi:hypothetical protein